MLLLLPSQKHARWVLGLVDATWAAENRCHRLWILEGTALDCLPTLDREEVYITPSTFGDGLHNPPTYKTVYITL